MPRAPRHGGAAPRRAAGWPARAARALLLAVLLAALCGSAAAQTQPPVGVPPTNGGSGTNTFLPPATGGADPNPCKPPLILIAGACAPPCGGGQELLPNGTCGPPCDKGLVRARGGGCAKYCDPGLVLLPDGSCSKPCWEQGLKQLEDGSCAPPCKDGLEMLRNGTCVAPCEPPSQRAADGACAVVPCPPFTVRDSAGGCAPEPCPTAGDERLPNGTCAPPCAPPAARLQDGSCAPPCPNPSDDRLADGRCTPPCAPPGYRLDNGACVLKPCPIGWDRLADGGCAVYLVPCGEGLVRQADGSCAKPCPDGLALNAAGKCDKPCPNGVIRNAAGSCDAPCPDGLAPSAAGKCDKPCPNGVIRNAAGSCDTPCPDGLVLNAGGDCNKPCPDGLFLDNTGNCDKPCPQGLGRADPGGPCLPQCSGVLGADVGACYWTWGGCVAARRYWDAAAQKCTDTPPVVPGACPPQLELLKNGTCAPPCPPDAPSRQPSGGCAAPCAVDWVRLAEGAPCASQSCPRGQLRRDDGLCVWTKDGCEASGRVWDPKAEACGGLKCGDSLVPLPNGRCGKPCPPAAPLRTRTGGCVAECAAGLVRMEPDGPCKNAPCPRPLVADATGFCTWTEAACISMQRVWDAATATCSDPPPKPCADGKPPRTDGSCCPPGTRLGPNGCVPACAPGLVQTPDGGCASPCSLKGLKQLPDGSCVKPCGDGLEMLGNGTCVKPCPAESPIRLAGGACAAPCPPGLARAKSSTCEPQPCAPPAVRGPDGACFTPEDPCRMMGMDPLPDGSCGNACGDGEERLSGGGCGKPCENGLERLPNGACAEPCAGALVRTPTGKCAEPCPPWYAFDEAGACQPVLKPCNAGLVRLADGSCGATSELLGCFYDAPFRTLPAFLGTSPKMTSSLCRQMAVDQKLGWYATQDGKACYGAKRLDDPTWLGPSDRGCATPCTSDPKEMCGGPMENSLYKIDDADLEVLGCYAFPADAKVLDESWTLPGMTADICRQWALGRGYAYYGVAAAFECWGGGAPDLALVKKSDLCDANCPPGQTGKCGGLAGVVKLYQLDSTAPDSSARMCTLSITLRDAQQGRRGIALNEIELYAQDGAKISPDLMQVWMSSAKLPDSGAKACFDGVTGGAAGDTSDAPPDPRRPGCMSLGPWPPAGDEGGGSPGILGGPTDPSPRLVARYPCAFGAAAGALSKVVVYNRLDCCQDGIQGYTLQLSNADGWPERTFEFGSADKVYTFETGGNAGWFFGSVSNFGADGANTGVAPPVPGITRSSGEASCGIVIHPKPGAKRGAKISLNEIEVVDRSTGQIMPGSAMQPSLSSSLTGHGAPTCFDGDRASAGCQTAANDTSPTLRVSVPCGAAAAGGALAARAASVKVYNRPGSLGDITAFELVTVNAAGATEETFAFDQPMAIYEFALGSLFRSNTCGDNTKEIVAGRCQKKCAPNAKRAAGNGACVCQPGSGGATCNACPPGQYSEGGNPSNAAPACRPCPRNTATLKAGAKSQKECSVCKPGSGGQGCQTCPVGQYSAGGNATHSRPACAACPPNVTTAKAGRTGRSECKVCRAGRGGRGCSPCPRGSYSAGGNETHPDRPCVACPANATSLGEGGENATVCSVCRPGHGARSSPDGRGGGGFCAPCGRGTFSRGGNATARAPACEPCRDGFTTLAEGSNSTANCTVCAPGRGGRGCGKCPRGSYSAGGNGTVAAPNCTPCPAPLTTAGDGATNGTACDVCPPGRGGRGCALCAAGSFSPGGNATSPRPPCLPCPANTTTPARGAKSRNDCKRATAPGRRLLSSLGAN